MIDRVGQVWLARKSRIDEDFEPCVVLRPSDMRWDAGWVLRPLERISRDDQEFGHYELQFRRIEDGGEDAWLKCRLA